MPRSSTTPSSAAATGLFFFFVKGASVLAALMFVGMLAFISSDMVARGNNSVAGGGNLVLSNVLCSEENSAYARRLARRLEELESALEEKEDRKMREDEGAKIEAAAPVPKCQPKKQVAFAKTHKTGSSTLQNIFFRYGVKNNLTFAMPPKSWMFSFKEQFHSSVVLNGPWAKLGFDMFIFHSIWNYHEMKKVLPDAAYITLLRDPVDAFESNYVYMGLEKAFKMDINTFATKRVKKDLRRRPNAIIDKNQLLWDLGVTPKEMEDMKTVSQKIIDFDRQFDLVLITERFEESLALLGDLLCWPAKELTFLKQNERVEGKRSNVTAEARKALKQWLWADYLLYDHFVKRLEQRVEKVGRKKVDDAVAELRKLNKGVESECVEKRGSGKDLTGEFRMALPIVLGYVLPEGAPPWCALYARSEPNFAKQLRDHQNLRVSSMKLLGLA